MLEQYAHSITQYLQAHTSMGGLFSFVISFLESLPIIGSIIPGSVTMTAVGVLIGSEILPLVRTFLWAIVGAFIGDLLGYWFGKYFNERLRNIWPFKKRPQLLSAGEVFFHKHGVKSIIIGRFIGPLRSLIPMIAGLLHMPLQKFILAAIPSATLWAILYMLPGIIIGAVSLQLPPSIATKFIIILLGIIIVISIFMWLIKILFIKCRNAIIRTEQHLWQGMQHTKYLKSITHCIANRNDPNDYHQLTWLLIFLGFGLLFCFDFYSVITKSNLALLNRPIFEFLRSLRHVSTDRVFVSFTFLGEYALLFTSGSLIFLWLYYKKYYRTALHWLLIICVGTLIPFLFKFLYYSPRPGGAIHISKYSSFPSGHTFVAVLLYGGLALLLGSHMDPKYRRYPYTIALLVVLAVGLSRIYLGVHWFTDAVASLALGYAFLALIILSYRRQTTAIDVSHFAWVAVITTVLIYTLFLSLFFHKNMTRYTLSWPSKTIEETQWWNKINPSLPIYRQNRLGKPVEPMNLQYAGDIQLLQSLLQQQGWKANPDLTLLKSTLQKLAQTQNNFSTVLPSLYLNHPPILFMIKELGDGKLVLKLWDSNVYLAQTWNVIYLGNLVEYQIDTDNKLIIYSYNVIDKFLPYLKGNRWLMNSLSITNIPQKLIQKKWSGELLQIKAPTF